MKHITALILSSSPVVTAGLTAMLTTMRDPVVTTVIVTAETLRHELLSHHATVIIADPLLISPGEIASVREEATWNPRFISISPAQLPQPVAKAYDANMTINDDLTQITAVIGRAVAEESEEDSSKELSPREKEVVVGIVKGLSNKEIAAEINVSVNTVMTHRRNIASKLQIHSPAGLTIYAIVSKLVKIEEISNQTL